MGAAPSWPPRSSGGEVAAVSGFDDCEGDGEVGHAAAGLSEEQHRSVFLDEAQAGEVLDEFAVNCGPEVEVEVGHAPVEREPRIAHPCCEAPVAVGCGLRGDEA